MATIISSKTSGVGGLTVTGDASGVLQLASANGTTALTIDASQNTTLVGTTTAINLAYTGTLTGSTGILNIGSGQVYKDASGNVGIGTSSPSSYGKLAVLSSDNTEATVVQSLVSNNTTAQLRLGFNRIVGYNTVAGNSYLDLGVTSSPQAIRIDSSGNLLVGTTSPYNATTDVLTVSRNQNAITQLLIDNQNVGASSQTRLALEASGGGWYIANQKTGNPLTFSNTTAERMRIDSSGNVTLQKNISVGAAAPTTSGTGITFPATQSASSNANTLDDYEEGTWTPVNVGMTFAGTALYNASYTKIGRLVTAIISILGQPTIHQWDNITLPFPISGSTAGIANQLGGALANSVSFASWSSNILVFQTNITIDTNGLHMVVVYHTTT
jgi:hypothetical protein